MDKNTEHNDKQAVSKAVAHEMETADTIFATEYIAPPPLFLASDPKHIKEEVENEEKDQKSSPAEISDQESQKNSPDPIGADIKSDASTVKANAPVKEEEKEEEIMDGPAADLIFADDTPEPPNDEGDEENGAAASGEGSGGDDDSPMQKKEGNGTSPAASSSRNSGVPSEVMSKMEGSMRADFSNVKINTNSNKAKESNALAFAQGNEVHFAPGQFNPKTSAGQKLLGHELAHVKQQREGKVKPTTSVNGMSVNNDPRLEKAADVEGDKAASFDLKNNQPDIKLDKSSTSQISQQKVGPYKEGYHFQNNETQPVQGFFPLLALGAVALGSALGIGAGAAIYSTTDDHRERNSQNRFPTGILRDSITGATGSYDYVEGGSNLYLDDENREWRLLSDAKNIFHQPEGAPSGFNPNKKFLSFDSRGGSFEAILQPNPDGAYTNNWLNSGDRQGTYNYYDPDTAPVGHVLYDVLPHMVPGGGNYGSTPAAQQKTEGSSNSSTFQLKTEEGSTTENPKSFSESAKVMQQKAVQFFGIIQKQDPDPTADATPAPKPPVSSSPQPEPIPTPIQSGGDQSNIDENVCLPDGSTENESTNTPNASAAPTPEVLETPDVEQTVNNATPENPSSGVDWDKFWSDNGLNIARTVAEPFRLIPAYGLIPGFAADTMETIGDLQAAEPTNDAFIEVMIGLRMPVVLFNNVFAHLLYIDELAQDAAIGSVLGVELVALTAPTAELLSSIRIGLLTAQTIIDGCVLAKSIMGMNSLASTPEEKKAYQDVFAGYDANLMMDGLDFILTGLDMGTGGLANGTAIGQFMRVGKNLVKRKTLFANLAQNVIISWAGVWGGNAVGAVTSVDDPAQPKLDSSNPIQKKDGETSLPREVAAQIILGELNKIEGAYNFGSGILNGTADQLEFVLNNVNELSEKLTDKEALPLLKSGMIKGLDFLLGQLQGIQQTQPFITSAEEKTVALHEFLDSAEKTLKDLQLPEVSIGDIPMVPGFMEDLAEGGANLVIENLNRAINEVKEMGFGAIQAMRDNATDLGTFLHTLTGVLEGQMDFIAKKIEDFRDFVNSIDSLEDIGDAMLAEISQLLGLDPPLTVELIKAGWEDLNKTIQGGFEMARNMVDEDVRGNASQGKFENNIQLKEDTSNSESVENSTQAFTPPLQLKEDQGDPVVQKFDWTFGMGTAFDNYKQDHYNRNQHNQAPQQEPVNDPNWELLSPGKSIYHQNGANGAGNKKYVSKNGGNFEAVYDSNGQLVTDDANMGTYNRTGPDDFVGHAIDDVVPYWLFGNNENDNTSLPNRVAGPRIIERAGNAAGNFLGNAWDATGGQIFGGSDDAAQPKIEGGFQLKSESAQLMIGDEKKEEEELQLKSESSQLKVKNDNIQLKEESNIDIRSNDNPAQLKEDDVIPSGVNVHKESTKATDMGALAYAQGSDIHFAPGQFKPDTRAGQELIGHELGHIVQQKEGRVQPTTQLKGVNVNNDKGLEKEADDFGVKFADSLQNKTQTPVQNKIESGFSLSNLSLQKKDNPHVSEPIQLKPEAGAGGGGGAGGGTSEGSGPISIDGSQTVVKDLMSSQPLPLFEKIKTAPASLNTALSSETTELSSSFPNIEQPTGIENQPLEENNTETAPHHLGYAGQGGSGDETVRTDAAPVNLGPNADLAPTQATAMPPSPIPTATVAPPPSTSLTLGEETVDYSAGPKPKVDTSGDADPAKMTSKETQDTAKVERDKTLANVEIDKDHGEEDIFPHYTELENLTPDVEIPQGQEIAVPEFEELTEKSAEIDAGFNAQAQSKLNEDMAIHVSSNEAEVVKMNQGSEEEWTTYETSKTEEEARVKTEQETAQKTAQTEVTTQQENWKQENADVKKKFVDDAAVAKTDYQGQIDGEINTADSDVQNTFNQAEIDAAEKANDAQKDADAKEAESDKGSSNPVGWFVEQVSKGLDWLKDQFNKIIDALKTVVEAIIKVAKTVANSIIEAARRAITGLIRAFGELLKTFVDIAFAAFPGIRDRIKEVIDTAVDAAVEVVNTLADGLKDFVNALLDALGAVLTFLLDAYQKFINLVLAAIELLTVGLYKLYIGLTNLALSAKQSPGQFMGQLQEEFLGMNLSDKLPFERDSHPPASYFRPPTDGEVMPSMDGMPPVLEKDPLSASDIDVTSISETAGPELSEDIMNSIPDGGEIEFGGSDVDELDLLRQAYATSESGEETIPGEGEVLTEADSYPYAHLADDPNARADAELDTFLGNQPSPDGASASKDSGGEKADAGGIDDSMKIGPFTSGQRFRYLRTQMWNGIKGWFNANKVAIIAGVVAAVVAGIALMIVTGGAITALIGPLMTILGAFFLGEALVKAGNYIRLFLTKAWGGGAGIADGAKDFARAMVIMVVELIFILLFDLNTVIKAAKKGLKGSIRMAAEGAQNTGRLIRHGVSESMSNAGRFGSRALELAQGGRRLVTEGLSSGYSRGVKTVSGLMDRVKGLKFKKFKLVRSGRRFSLYGKINPWILLANGDIVEVSKTDITTPGRIGETVKFGLDGVETTGRIITNGTGLPANAYRRIYEMFNAGTANGHVIHHMIEQQVMNNIQLATKSFINNANRLKAIPKGIINDVVHLSKIRVMWNNVYPKLDKLLKMDMITEAQYIQGLEHFMKYTDDFIEDSLSFAASKGKALTKADLEEFCENWIRNRPVDDAVLDALKATN